MAFNALQLVNVLLSRFGRAEVTSGTFSSNAEAVSCLRDINMAIQKITTSHPFVWAMKNDPGQIAAVAGTSVYTLASDVAHVIAAKHIYNGGSPIKVVDRSVLEQYRSDRSQSSDRSTPRVMSPAGVSQSSASSTPLIRMELWPVPDSNFASQIIYYYYTFLLTDLSAATDVPLIPGDFHWLIIEVAETLRRRGPIRVGGDGAQSQIDLFSIASDEAKKGMARLISRDSAVSGSEFAWESNEADQPL